MRPTVDDDKRLKLRNFRMSDPDWEILQEHFEQKRIPVSSGIRMIIAEYMKREGLLK